MKVNEIDLVKSYHVRPKGPLVVVIPKIIREKLEINAGTKFLVSYDNKKRLIFTRVN